MKPFGKAYVLFLLLFAFFCFCMALRAGADCFVITHEGELEPCLQGEDDLGNRIQSGAYAAGDVQTYIFTTRLEDGTVINSVARSDGICPVSGCNSTVRVQVPHFGVDDLYQSRTTIRSTGQLTVELEELE